MYGVVVWDLFFSNGLQLTVNVDRLILQNDYVQLAGKNLGRVFNDCFNRKRQPKPKLEQKTMLDRPQVDMTGHLYDSMTALDILFRALLT